MDQVIKQKWTAALRSGNYTQGKGCLKDSVGNYCCLGVLADICNLELGMDEDKGQLDVIIEDGQAEGYIPLQKLVGDRVMTGFLAKKNDTGETFSQIADYIDENL